MNKKSSKSKKKVYDNDILLVLIEDPTKSLRDMAKELNTYRQKIWRVKKRLQDERIIWGYTAVIDESKLGNVSYILLMKTKPMNRGLADLIIKRLKVEIFNHSNYPSLLPKDRQPFPHC